MVAIEPLVELLLEIGTTSPEAESLLRSVFIHKARSWLTAQAGEEPPSDARVALVTGVHRNFVREILAEPPKIARTREGRAYLAGRVLHAWHTNAAYRNDNGQPRDLPEKGPLPSFATLVATSLPGASSGVVLQELIRAGAVESLSDHRVRVRARTAREPGMRLDNVLAYGLQARSILATLTRKLCDPQSSAYSVSTSPILIEEERVPLIRDVLRRRADAFISGLEQELAGRSQKLRRRSKKLKLAVSVVETADLKQRARSCGDKSK
jgi:hypothetical protein